VATVKTKEEQMSYWCNHTISELKLRIPKKDLPLKSDLVVGHTRPHMLYPEDEASYNELHPEKDTKDYIEFRVPNSGWAELSFRERDSMAIGELEELCIKYGGTLVCSSSGEDGETDYTRIRDGVRKKVKIVEED
jgi:hypothetical protein